VTFADLADVYGGSTPKTTVSEYWGGDNAWAVPRDVTALSAPYLFETERHISARGLQAIGNRLHPPGSIFMTSRATIGAFALPQRPCAVNQGFIVAVPREPALRWFLFHEMRARVGDMLDLANGSTFLELSRGNFKTMPVVHPDASDLQHLDAMLAPLHALFAATVSESARLVSLRDTLLPSLMTGELRVRDAESLVGEAV
jgi:type I restriction enzyme S subunit